MKGRRELPLKQKRAYGGCDRRDDARRVQRREIGANNNQERNIWGTKKPSGR